MIKVEDDDVGLSAVDARMSPKVFADERPVLFAISLDPGNLLPDVGVTVADVMLTPVLRVADTATALTSPLRFAVKSEIFDWLRQPAVIATFGLGGDRYEGPLRSGSALRSA